MDIHYICPVFLFHQMIKKVLQALADENFGDHYPILHGASSSDVKPFVLMVKKKRPIYKRPLTKSEFIIIAGLENYVKEEQEFLKRVNSKKHTQDNLEIDDYNEDDEPAQRLLFSSFQFEKFNSWESKACTRRAHTRFITLSASAELGRDKSSWA